MARPSRTLITGATILSMDGAVGDLPKGDILVEDDRIIAIAPVLQADDAERVDAEGRIAVPGFVNAHMHTWQTGLRSLAADWTLLEYFRWVHAGLATRFRPEDIGIATLVGALGQIDAGTTTLVDWCHNNPTPEHTDAAVEALARSGIRAAFFHGSPKPDPKPGEPHFSEVPHPRAEIERLRRGMFSGEDGLMTLGLAILGPHYSTLEVARADFRMAREFGLVASMHQGGGAAKTPGGWETLLDEGLVGPGINVVHGNDLSDALFSALVDQGASFSVTPENEMTQGHGFPVTGRLLKRGVAPSLGVDLESVLAGDMMGVARVALGMQRVLDNTDSRRDTGAIPPTSTVRVRQALEWITIEGARMLGQEGRIGSLAPGKQADITLIDARALHLQPVHDPVATVVMQAGRGDVEAVMIAGRFRKKNGKLLAAALDDTLARLARSGARIVDELGLKRTAA
ncbi:putative metal-dependent hydrolase [Azorhizobium caulinodans ORS 571]|uniref:Putative metal-dependent hydrolase n=1 Tax=Azorhizobium caulinodans (strain ATCC 43989 / DSM 5975 / JCM 20966 / LMG 6465 / NBRC 14845 / NCIMB 13405 / ORS 571) TaxID=438753 RepID=A8I1R4_AZOC5|nr:amidohydrolase family protein [Azorhizobium caulinodans]BAF87410.1 putative metal-dependent hydrolase [Azorhizobium caulinodans ORS 571]